MAENNSMLAAARHQASTLKHCDICEEAWEPTFFCANCSGLHHFDGEMALEPSLFWDGSPNDEYEWVDREPEYKDVCFNCCSCCAV